MIVDLTERMEQGVEDFQFDKHCMYMVFAPKFLTPGVVPYGTPSGDPNKAVRSAVIKHFGDNGCTFHQIMAMWRFLHSKGFECKRLLSLSAENYQPSWIEKDVI